jgi:ferrous-iron efflux pump FieF
MNATETQRRAGAGSAALASIATALFLLALKGWATLATGSVSMLGSLIDSGLDLVASLVTFWGVRVAAEPADHDHRFGHGKAEALAALFQIALIAASAVGIVERALNRLVSGSVTTDAEYGVAVSLVAIAATLGLTAFQRRIVRRTGSIAIATDRIHYQSDLLLNVAVIAALLLEQYAHLTGADPVFGILIAAWLAWGGWRASRAAIHQLMDKEWPEEKRQRFLEITMRHPANHGTHDFRTRSSGTHHFAQFHIWLDPQMTVAEAHGVMEGIEADLAREFPEVEVLIHVDPEGQVDAPADPLRETVELKGSRP